MQYSSALHFSCIAITNIIAHGVIDSVHGANGVTMPVIQRTPRDCASPRCGSETDTVIIRGREIGTNKVSALGRTQGSGPIVASKMISMFMEGGSNATATKQAREIHATNLLRRSLVERAANGSTKTPKGTIETGIKAAAGAGTGADMPTCSDYGKVTINFH
ncbi:hypothetical protein K3495_g6442 [Podosphaera aphanis]|nr:hypothetical protein K3495_g6442 [Podosphaera aphanis]